MGQPQGQDRSLPEVFITLCERASIRAWIPDDVQGQCCGLPFGSKGFVEAHRTMLVALVDAMWRWARGGELPVVIDATSCTYSILSSSALLDSDHDLNHEAKRRLRALRIVDVTAFACDSLLPRLAIVRAERRVALHPTCASRKLGLTTAIRRIAEACVTSAVVPDDLACCATAGDRGLMFPELTRSATRAERAEVEALDADGFYSSNLTCEIGLSEASNNPYISVLYLLEEASRAPARSEDR